MIQIIPEHRLTVVFTNDESGNDIKTFVDIMDKCYKESKRPGFKSMFNDRERDLIRGVQENIKDEHSY